MPRKGKGKGVKPRGKRGWFWLLVKLSIVFGADRHLRRLSGPKIRSRIDGKVWQLRRQYMAAWLTLSQKCPSARTRW